MVHRRLWYFVSKAVSWKQFCQSVSHPHFRASPSTCVRVTFERLRHSSRIREYPRFLCSSVQLLYCDNRAVFTNRRWTSSSCLWEQLCDFLESVNLFQTRLFLYFAGYSNSFDVHSWHTGANQTEFLDVCVQSVFIHTVHATSRQKRTLANVYVAAAFGAWDCRKDTVWSTVVCKAACYLPQCFPTKTHPPKHSSRIRSAVGRVFVPQVSEIDKNEFIGSCVGRRCQTHGDYESLTKWMTHSQTYLANALSWDLNL